MKKFFLVDSSTGEVVEEFNQYPFSHDSRKSRLLGFLKKALIFVVVVSVFSSVAYLRSVLGDAQYKAGFESGRSSIDSMSSDELFEYLIDRDDYALYDYFYRHEDLSDTLSYLYVSLGEDGLIDRLSEITGKTWGCISEFALDIGYSTGDPHLDGYLKGQFAANRKNDAEWAQFFEDAQLTDPETGNAITSREDFEAWKSAYYAS